MSAIQEALERVRREREASGQEDLSWVRATARLDPCGSARKANLSLRLGLLVLAGAAIGMTVSQIPWTGSELGDGVLKSRYQGTYSGLPKNSGEIQKERSFLEAGEKEAFQHQEPLQLSSGKDAALFSPDLRQAMAAARRMQQEGDLRGAEKRLSGFLEKEPNSVEALVALADLYVQHLSDADRAIALYQRAIQENPKHASFWVNLGVAYMKNGNLAKAVETILWALELDPSMVEAHYNMACVLALQGKSQEAAGFLEKAASMDSRVFEWAMRDPDLISVRDFFAGKFQLP